MMNSLERFPSDLHQKLIGYSLHQIDKNILKRHNDALEPFGVNFVSAIILGHIIENEHDASINQRFVESFSGLSNPAITKIIAGLVNLGLIERRCDEVDKRSNRLVSTEFGRQQDLVFRRTIIESDRNCFASLTDGERQTLIKILKKLK
jgi:MarR family transcriptional repressor of mepA